MDEIIAKLNAIAVMSEALAKHLRSILLKQVFKKGSLLLNAGAIAGHIYFVKTGLIRSYSMLDGKKVTIWFMKEGDIIISVVSFLRQVPAADCIEALENIECWGITHAELWETYRLFPEFLLHGLLLTTEYYCRSEERREGQQRQTPEAKFAIMMHREPEVVRRARNGDIASYLNVSIRTYADIKKAFKQGRIPPYNGRR